jgi:hypothetical protein
MESEKCDVFKALEAILGDDPEVGKKRRSDDVPNCEKPAKIARVLAVRADRYVTMNISGIDTFKNVYVSFLKSGNGMSPNCITIVPRIDNGYTIRLKDLRGVGYVLADGSLANKPFYSVRFKIRYDLDDQESSNKHAIGFDIYDIKAGVPTHVGFAIADLEIRNGKCNTTENVLLQALKIES